MTTAVATYAEESRFSRGFRAIRHPLRVVAMALAAVSLAWGITLTTGLVAAVIGSLVGVILGERMHRTRYRTSALLGGFAASIVVAFFLAGFSLDFEIIPSIFGVDGALHISSALRYGGLAFGTTAFLRTASLRHPAASALELVAVVVAVAALFASHRDGIIARPLWISDWAWQSEIDPADVFLAIGAGSAVLLAVLLVLENKGGRTMSSLLVIPILALIAMWSLDVVGRPTPEAEDGIGLTDNREGDEPNLDDQGTPYGGEDGGSRNPRGQDAGGDGGRGPDGGQDGGRGLSPDGSLDGGGGAGGDGGPDAGDGGGATGLDGGDGGGSASAQDAGDGGSSSGGDASSDGGAGQDGGDGGAGLDGGDGGSSADGGDGGSSADGGDGGSRDAGDGGGQDASSDAGDSGRPPPRGQRGQGTQQGGVATEQQLDDDQDISPNSSPAPMAVVLFEDDYSPPAQAYYFRQEAWSEFNGTRLVPSTMPGTDGDVLGRFPTARTLVNGPSPEGRARVRARVAMLVEHQKPFALESPISFAPTPNPNPDRFVTSYRFEALAQETDYPQLLGRKAGATEWSDEIRAHYLVTHPDPRFQELAEAQVATLPPNLQGDPFAKALAIKRYLDENLIYSTRERHRDAPDPTTDFLFGNKTGYCVHFAHSAVFLFRSVGVPARIGTGYMVPEENRGSGSGLLIKGGDAHAWPEIYLDGIGWIVLDIAASENLDPPGQPHDDDLQRMLAEMAREEPADPMEETPEEPEDEGPPRNWGRDLGIAGLVLLALALLVLYSIKLYRRVIPLLGSARAAPRLFYRATLDRLAEAGFAREIGETREAFAERVKDRAPSLAKLTSMHVEAKLGPPARIAATPPNVSELRTHARAVRRELGKSVKLWRRWLGLLHPTSFFDSR